MYDWLVAHYDTFKDFAAPAATMVVAITAGLITWSFNRRQLIIAKDRLKLDLLERRHRIYRAAQELIEYSISSLEKPGEEKKAFILLGEIGEARLFFDDKSFAVFKEIADTVDAYLVEDHTPVREREFRLKLSALHRELPEKVFAALRFDQIT